MSDKQRGKALRKYMRAQGMKRQRELARDLGMSDTAISRYFSGEVFFSAKTALRIAKKTGVPMEALFQ